MQFRIQTRKLPVPSARQTIILCRQNLKTLILRSGKMHVLVIRTCLFPQQAQRVRVKRDYHCLSKCYVYLSLFIICCYLWLSKISSSLCILLVFVRFCHLVYPDVAFLVLYTALCWNCTFVYHFVLFLWHNLHFYFIMSTEHMHCLIACCAIMLKTSRSPTCSVSF